MVKVSVPIRNTKNRLQSIRSIKRKRRRRKSRRHKKLRRSLGRNRKGRI
jgi:hypothetical protein